MSVKALNRRAEAIRKARPAYKELLDFYLTIFRRQIEWRDRLEVNPQPVNDDLRRKCFQCGQTLIERFDPGIEAESLLRLWTEMKGVFRGGNEVLHEVIAKITLAEESGDFTPTSWLLEQRPDRYELVKDAAGKMGIDQQPLATLVRAVTFPHWQRVSEAWLPEGDPLQEWRRFHCPTCGGSPALGETRKRACGAEGITAAYQRLMHCPFCGSSWPVPTLDCPNCGSTKERDAKYFFTADEPEWRIDFCKGCQRYVKVIDGEKVSGPIHLGLELLTATHLDVIAQAKSLKPLEVCA